MVHLLSQLDPMVWLMMLVVAIGFVVSAVVLVELLPGGGRREPDAAVEQGGDILGGDIAPAQPAEGGGASPDRSLTSAARHPD